ncbi:RHS repeat-associated protein [Chthoniobacter flavus]|nr:RHS repeat-associated core domain-containing protein [Chthoniobacter flavus]TCO81905.1 RHS repeat-associated protein [Chthoniobacter flavus]
MAQLIVPQYAATIPGWWVDDSAQTRIIGAGAAPSNFAPANLGQLKYVASQAKKHLDQKLAAVGGAGNEINALVAGFEPRAGQNYTPEQIAAFRAANYAPINLGQLKAVVAPFYRRLLAVGYNTQFNLILHGYPGTWAYDYPWNPNDPWNQAGAGDKTPNYVMANIGQLKMAFSFDVALNSDGSLLPAILRSIEGGMSNPNAHPGRLGNGGNTALPPTYGTASPGGGGAGPQLDPNPDGSIPDTGKSKLVPPVLTVSGTLNTDFDTGITTYDPTMADLEWTVFQSTAVSVTVLRSTGVDGWETVGAADPSTVDFYDGDRLANQSYTYKIVVTLADGKTVASDSVAFSVPFFKGWLSQTNNVTRGNPGFKSFAGTPVTHYLKRDTEEEDTQKPDSDTTITESGSSIETMSLDGSITYNTGNNETYTEIVKSQNSTKETDGSATQNQDGTWTGTLDGSDWGGFDLLEQIGLGTETTTQTHYEYELTGGGTGNSQTLTVDLDNEYTPDQFFQDTIQNSAVYADSRDWTAGYAPTFRSRNTDNDQIGFGQNYYKASLCPSAPASLKVYKIFVQLPPPGLDPEDFQTWNDNPPPPQIVGTDTITGGTNTESGVIGIDPTTKPDVFKPDGAIGTYWLTTGINLAGTGYVGDPSSPDPNAVTAVVLNSQMRKTVSPVVRSPDATGQNGLNGTVDVETVAAVGGTWTVQISDPGDFAVTDASGNPVYDGEVFKTAPHLIVTPDGWAAVGESVTITVSQDWAGVDLGTDHVTFTKVATVGDTPPSPNVYTVPFDEASGSRYRKIGLNGRPLADEKPQQTAESDEEKEETYIDALTLELRHSTTDVYVPLAGSDLTLSARRDTSSEVWNMKSGLRPHERFDRPFGAGWTSNLGAHKEVGVGSDRVAYTSVVDQNGARHRFVRVGTGGGQAYVPIPSDSRENSDYLTTLSSDGATFTDRYGTKIVFSTEGITQDIKGDRDAGTGETVTISYPVLTITDRLSNTLTYAYPPNATTLIPQTITSSSGLVLSIDQDASGHITHVWDPNGNQYSYGYKTLQYTYNDIIFNETVLSSVTGPDGQVTNYDAALTIEPDQSPIDVTQSHPTDKYHIDVTKITDPNGNGYEFTYAFDNTRFAWDTQSGPFQETGGSSYVTSVLLPGGLGHATFSKGASKVALVPPVNGQIQMVLSDDSLRESVITDAGGNGITYSWGGGTIFTVGELVSTGPPPRVVFYQSMSIDYGGGKGESFQFDPKAGLALAAVTDLSTNTTSYAYTEQYSAPAGGLYASVFPWAGFATFYPDPTSQTDAAGNTKSFTYGPYRIMASVTDENGRKKAYDIDPSGRRTSEYVYQHGDDTPLVQETDFAYSDTFPGVVTLKTVRSFGEADWVHDLVTQYVLDGNGRVQQEVVDPDGLKLTTSYTYDNNGNKISATDPRGNTTGFEYDARNRLTRVVYADGSAKTIEYYANGTKWHEVDENGHQTSFAYDALNRVTLQTRTVAAGDVVTQYGYRNAVEPKQSVIDPDGNQTTFGYDGLMRLTSVTDALNHTTTYDYSGPNSGSHAFDSSGFKPTTIQDPRGYVTTMTYDQLYHATGKSVQYRLTPPLFSATTTGYDNVGNPTSVVDPLLHTTTTDFDALNRPTHVKYADNTETFATYTSTGLKWLVQDELGNVTETQYDAAGRPVEVLGPAVDDGLNPEQVDRTGHLKQPTTHTGYDDAGNVISTKNPLGNEWDYVYDVRNRKIEEDQPSVTNAENGAASRPTIYTGYDYVGNVLWVQDARGFTTETAYDEANRPVTVTAPPVLLVGGAQAVRPATTKGYDAVGNVLTVTDANHHTTTNTYDFVNRLQTTTDAANITVTYGYDEVGNRISVKDGLNQQTTFAYDGLNRNTTTTDAAGKTTTLGYDALNKVSRTDALGQLTSYGYDLRNRLTSVTYPAPGTDNRTYGYDLTGNLLSVTEPAKGSTADAGYTYDALHRVLTETSNGATHTYRYDLAGNRLGVQYGLAGGGNGRLIFSTYDALNRLSTLTEGARATTYGYDLGGNVVIKTLPNADAVTTSYDGLGRAYEEEGVSARGTLYHYLSLCDGVGNLRSSTEYTAGVAPRTVSMGYDNADRLTSEVITGPSGQLVSNISYEYDAANNRFKKTANGVVATYTYNNLNQLTTWSDTAGKGASYGYDFNGNRISRTVSGTTDVYRYDVENRLVSLSLSTLNPQLSTVPGTYSYVYDYRTRRVARTENASTTQMVFSGGTSVQEYSQLSPLTSQLSVEYVRGSDWGGGVGGVLYSMRGGNPSYDHYDRRGDVTARTDSSGAVTWQASYEAFGTRPAEFGTTQDRQKANTKEEDPTGLLDEGMRYRDLETGTFITRDPAGFIDGPNVYAYVRQNPWTRFDPEGLAEETIGQVYTAINHESKELYVGQVNGPGVMAEGGTPSRHENSRHQARELLDKEGTIRTYDDVVVDDKWKQVAKENGIPENSARANTVKSMERAQLEAAMEKYPDYKVINKIGEEEGSLGKGIIGEEKAAQYTEMFEPKMAGKPRTEVNIEGKWTASEKVRLKPGRGTAYGLAIGLAFMVAGEVTGGNQAAADEIHEQLQMYQRNPNPATGAYLGVLVGNAFGAPDSVTLMLQQSFMKHAENSQ